MQIKSVALAAASLALASGCATQFPQNAEEFRQAAPGAFMGKHESFEVARPYREVSDTFRRKAPECLNVTIRTTSQSSTSYSVVVTTYRPTVVVGSARTELHVQQNHEKGVLKVYKEPEGGYYLMVADATPIDRNRTRIDFYRPSMGHDTMVRAIRNWATGENVGCPDFTKS